MLSLKTVPQLYQANYSTSIELQEVKVTLDRYAARQKEFGGSLVLIPDFQRGHVWTADQQSSYMEWLFRGGESGREIVFNHPNWQGTYEGDMVCVDGLQRLTAVTSFFENKVTVWGYSWSEIDQKSLSSLNCLYFKVGKMKTRSELLTWYIQMNDGGTPHSREEIQRVRNLLQESM